MNLHFSKNYVGDNRRKYNFPSDGLPQDKKDDKEYYLKATQAIVSKHLNNVCEIPYDNWGNRETFHEIWSYATGRQSVEKYKDILIGKKRADGCRRKNTWNINWKPIDILPKKLGDVLSFLLKIKYDIISNAIDPMATQQREDAIAMAKLMTDDNFRTMGAQINEMAGAEVIDPSSMPQAQTGGQLPFKDERQVEMAQKIGVFILEVESAMQILLEKTATDSKSKTIDKLIKRDFLYYNIAAKYSHSVGDSVLEDWIDVRNAIIPYSPYNDFRDATYFGFYKTMSIAELVKLECFTDDEIVEIARKYNAAPFNSSARLTNFDMDYSRAKQDGLGMAVLHSIQVDVAKVWWIGNKRVNQTSITRDKDGGLSLNKVDENYELSERDKKQGKKKKEYTTQTVYTAMHIIGTDCVFNEGEEYNVKHKKNENGKYCAELPMSAYKLDGPSMAERCMGFIDDANIANYKKRMLMKNLNAGPGIKINKAAFENVMIDNKLYSPLDLIALFTDEGVLIVDDKNPWGDNNRSGSRPIDTIPSDVFQRMLGCRNEMQFNLEMVDIITGLNQTFSAQQPSSETGLGVSKIALSATENSIYQMVDGFEQLANHSYNVKCNQWKIICANMEDKKRDTFATRAMRFIHVGKEISWHDYGIKMEAGINETEKLQLYQRAQQLADFRRQSGTGGIMPSDELLIGEMIRQGNVKQARLALSQIEEFRAEQEEQKAQQRMQENAQMQQQSNEQAMQGKQQELQMEAQAESQKNASKFQYDLALQKQKAEDDRKKTALQNVFGYGLDNYNKTVKY